MLSFMRGAHPPRRHTAAETTISYEDGRSSQTFYPPSEEYFVQHVIPDNKSMLNPLQHIHFFQDETFWVEKGEGIWTQPTEPNPARRQTVGKTGDTVHLPPGTYHQFQNASETEPLIVRFRIDPDLSRVKGEQFFRNFFGYLDDCRLAKTDPSLFQLQLFMITVESGIAIPVPGPNFVKWWVSRLVMLLLGLVIGEWLLGYQRTYPQYYRGKDTGVA